MAEIKTGFCEESRRFPEDLVKDGPPASGSAMSTSDIKTNYIGFILYYN